MATSGTYKQSSISVSRMIDHIIRRCGKNPATISPEDLKTVRETLYMVLLNLSSKGLNLWAVQNQFVGLTPGKATYVLPTGTLDILNLVLSQPTRVEGTDTIASQSITTDLTDSSKLVRVGLKFETISASETIQLDYSTDSGSNWSNLTTLTKTDWETGTWYWVDLDPFVTGNSFRAVSTTSAITLTEFYLASQVRDIPMTPFNRDDYMSQVNKDYSVSLPTNYFFEKLINPQVTLWGVPNNDYSHLTARIHRQVEDVGSLTGQLAIPDRWLDSVIWVAAKVAAFELPDISDVRLGTIQQMAMEAVSNVETDETDGAPIYLTPSIGNYNG